MSILSVGPSGSLEVNGKELFQQDKVKRQILSLNNCSKERDSNMKVFVLMGTNADGTECVGVFKSKESLNETMTMFDDPTVYTENPYDEYHIVEEKVR